jgi:hypothetical protein
MSSLFAVGCLLLLNNAPAWSCQVQSCQNLVQSVCAVGLGKASWLLHMLPNAWWHMDWLFGCGVSK